MIPRVAAQCWENGSSLFYGWRRQKTAWHTTPAELGRTESRLRAQIRALQAIGPDVWQVVEERLSPNDAGEAFAATLLALTFGDHARLRSLLERGKHRQALTDALALAPHGALAEVRGICEQCRRAAAWWDASWHTGLPAEPDDVASSLASSDLAIAQAAARVACSARQRDAAGAIARRAAEGDAVFRQLAPLELFLLDALDATALVERLPGEPIVVPGLAAVVEQLSPGKVMRHCARTKCFLAGCTALPARVEFLLDEMLAPERARFAWVIFSALSGLPLGDSRFTTPLPTGISRGPNDDPGSDDVNTDPDEGVPFPNRDALRDWWQHGQGDFAGGRLLLGRPLDETVARQALVTGSRFSALVGAAWLAVNKPSIEHARVCATLLDTAAT